MAKRLKYQNIDELVIALNTWVSTRPNELIYRPTVRVVVHGVDADSKQQRRLMSPEEDCAILGFRKEASKSLLLAGVRVKDVVVLMNLRTLSKHFPKAIDHLNAFAVSEGFDDIWTTESKIRAAERRSAAKTQVTAKSEEAKASKEERETILQQYPAYGSW